MKGNEIKSFFGLDQIIRKQQTEFKKRSIITICKYLEGSSVYIYHCVTGYMTCGLLR